MGSSVSLFLKLFSSTAKINSDEVQFIRCNSGKMTSVDAKTYLAQRNVPALFEVIGMFVFSSLPLPPFGRNNSKREGTGNLNNVLCSQRFVLVSFINLL